MNCIIIDLIEQITDHGKLTIDQSVIRFKPFRGRTLVLTTYYDLKTGLEKVLNHIDNL